MRRITDGTSHTLLLMEMIQAPTGSKGPVDEIDRRGRIWLPDGGSSQISTLLAPNSKAAGNSAVAIAPNKETGAGGDISNCVNHPDQGLPCFDAGSAAGAGHTLAARSRHPGGVQISMCDGSSRMVNDDIDIWVWRALSTRAGDEVVGDF